MYKVEKITKENIKDLEFAYNDFFIRSYNDYGFEILPLEFPDVAHFIESGILNILGLYHQNILKSFFNEIKIFEVKKFNGKEEKNVSDPFVPNHSFFFFY